MALVKYGGGIIQMSGSIAGNTFARNRSGNYVRARTKPVNPKSDLQDAVRSAMADLTAEWSLVLTDAMRIAWNLYAASVTMKNKLGESINLTGFNHYLRTNIIRVQSGLAPISAGPTVWELPEKDPSFAIAAAEGTQTISYTFDNTMLWAKEVGGHMFKFQGRPQNPQRNFFAGPWRLHGKIDGAVSPPSSADDEADAPYTITALQRQWCYARIMRADGRLSEPFRADCFCT